MTTTLVLGAGASYPYGYPLGSQLRTEILKLPRHNPTDFGRATGINLVKITEFVEAFANSEMYSVDAFLARRPEFSDIGRLCIAYILLRAEQTAHLRADQNEHWLRYFFNTIAGDKWEEIDFKEFSIVTFNYDRLVEHYLLSALRNAYGKSERQALDKIGTLQIVHVYGALGPVFPHEMGYQAYGASLNPNGVQRAAKSLKVIPEGRADEPWLEEARRLLKEADRVAFLGFGFDPTNLERLDARATCAARGDGLSPPPSKRVVASCFEMTEAEARRAMQNTKGQNLNMSQGDGGPYQTGFWPISCYRLLRETLILQE